MFPKAKHTLFSLSAAPPFQGYGQLHTLTQGVALDYPVFPLRGDFSKVSQDHRSWLWGSVFGSALVDIQLGGAA
ncbi:MAG: hypothetical protein L3K26_08820 [Candidatus Hydrogenedentes bacterium]|nr:hypothetical protein [Candidatus Hydrogenedentota bacterium]